MSFNSDLKDVHLIYNYDVTVDTRKHEKWRYEIWFSHATRVTYAIHGGPMKGRYNYQKATYQRIRPGELWQVNWLEETGTVVSLVYDILNKKITTLIAFSKGHWAHPTEAHGDKRYPGDFARWRSLAKEGIHTYRHMLSDQADIVETFKGPGELKPIDETWATL